MAEFRTKVITLAGLATMLAGMAYGQATVAATAVGGNAVFIRAEGTTELIAPTTVSVVQPASSPAASLSLTVYLSPSVTITSETVSKVSEASASVGSTIVAGTVTGSSVAFSGIPIPANATAVPVTTVVFIDNIRVNASTIAVATGVPTGVSETIFVGGTNVTPNVTTPYNVAFALNGLGAATASGATANTICSAAVVTAANFTVTVPEGFAGSFKTLADETGFPMAGGANNSATSGTRVAITFANVPTGVSLYVPLTINSSVTTGGTAMLQLIASSTAATSSANNVADAAVKNEPTKLGAVTLASGSGTVFYEVSVDNKTVVNSFPIPVYFVSAAGVLTAPASAVTATVTLAPLSASSNYPNFVSGSSTTTVKGSTYIACTTTLLFPYVTNSSGFETGIALSNTSLDNLGSSAASSVSTQSGTCTLSFYGNTPATSNPAAFTTSSVTAGTDTAFTLTSAAGAGFTGYVLANCNFQYAHGYAFIAYGLGTSTGAVQGYIAFPLAQPRALTAGVESLGN